MRVAEGRRCFVMGRVPHLGYRNQVGAGYPGSAITLSHDVRATARGRPWLRRNAEDTAEVEGNDRMGSVVKKRRKRMAKKKHRKLLRKTRVQRRRLGK
jgi:Mitochondrial mRNA-processing protein COX24, C-terminal